MGIQPITVQDIIDHMREQADAIDEKIAQRRSRGAVRAGLKERARWRRDAADLLAKVNTANTMAMHLQRVTGVVAAPTLAPVIHGPVVNINGTSRDSLIAQCREVIGATRFLQAALGQAMPHGRDYQTAENTLYKHDRDAWVRLVEYMETVRRVYEGIGERLVKERGNT